jgi:predicted Zn-dependent protease
MALREAVKKEDALAYNEPSDEFFPVRHLLGAALLNAGRPAEAEAVYREDLRRNPENGWALHGLAKALEAQWKKADAEKARFKEAWRHADTELTASAF